MLRRIASLGITIGYAGVSGLTSRAKDRCVVLYYHGVTGAQVAGFTKQMQWLRSNYHVLPLRALWECQWSGRCVCITFDDGLDNVRQHALPVLVALNLPATVFVVADNLGRTPLWPIDARHPDRDEILSTAEQLLDYPKHLIEIGSHTLTHPDLVALKAGTLSRELAHSKKALESLLEREVISLSVPFGSYNEQTLTAARDAGYSMVVTCDPEYVPGGHPDFAVGRFKATPEDWDLEFRLKAQGAYQWRRHLRRTRAYWQKQGKTALHQGPNVYEAVASS